MAQDIIAACKEAGGPDFAVSVKTRIGFDSYDDVFEEWVSNLLEAEPDGMFERLTKSEKFFYKRF